MKKTIKINTNKPVLSSDEIKKHQNFKQLWQHQYLKPKPFYKNSKFLGGIILILITAIVVIIENQERRENTAKQTEILPIEKSTAIQPIQPNLMPEKDMNLSHEYDTVQPIPRDSMIKTTRESLN